MKTFFAILVLCSFSLAQQVGDTIRVGKDINLEVAKTNLPWHTVFTKCKCVEGAKLVFKGWIDRKNSVGLWHIIDYGWSKTDGYCRDKTYGMFDGDVLVGIDAGWHERMEASAGDRRHRAKVDSLIRAFRSEGNE